MHPRGRLNAFPSKTRTAHAIGGPRSEGETHNFALAGARWPATSSWIHFRLDRTSDLCTRPNPPLTTGDLRITMRQGTLHKGTVIRARDITPDETQPSQEYLALMPMLGQT